MNAFMISATDQPGLATRLFEAAERRGVNIFPAYGLADGTVGLGARQLGRRGRARGRHRRRRPDRDVARDGRHQAAEQARHWSGSVWQALSGRDQSPSGSPGGYGRRQRHRRARRGGCDSTPAPSATGRNWRIGVNSLGATPSGRGASGSPRSPSEAARPQNADRGSEYSTLKTALPASRNGCSRPHSWYWKHCSLTAKSKRPTSERTRPSAFLSPTARPCA